MRDVPTAEADVVPNPVLGNALESVIEGLNSQTGPLTVVLRTLLYKVIVHVGKNSVVHLNEHSRIVDRAVFFAQSISDGVHIVLFRWVVFVDAIVGRAGRRDDRKKRFLHIHGTQRRFQVANVTIDGVVVTIFDGTDAGFGRHSGSHPGKFRRHHFGKSVAVAPEPVDGAQLIWPMLEAGD